MSLAVGFREIFTELTMDPISREIMTDPVINACGHTFQRGEIDGWVAHCISTRAPVLCPLCKQSIQGLISNILLRQAAEILIDPSNARVGSLEDLSTEDQALLQRARDNMQRRIERDRQEGVPSRLAERTSFVGRAVASVKAYYGCG